MPDAPDLIPIALVFASGSPDQNRAMIDRFAAAHPDLPLHVVAEFEPHRGEWIPWHVLRPSRANRAAIRAALGGVEIGAAAMALARGTALGPMRLAALRIAGAVLVAYDEQLEPVGVPGLPVRLLARSAGQLQQQFRPGGRGHKWLRRLANPADSEIPVRARVARTRGLIGSRLRGVREEQPLRGAAPLLPGITVVVPTRDGRELLQSMLPPLLPQIRDGEVIVVDNGSTDGTAAWLAREYPGVRVIESASPLSFAKAVNAGIVQAGFSKTLLLNNDMIVEPGFAAALDAAFERVLGLFCATAQILFPPGVRREETGKAVWRHENPLDFPVRCDDPHPGEDLTWVLYGSGGCSLFDTALLRQLGGVSEVYDPAYVEDMDFGYRAWKRGWPTVFCAAARVEHRHRATTSRFFTARELDFFVERNYLRFLIHAIGDTELFRKLWREAIRRLQLRAMQGREAALDTLRAVPSMAPRPPAATGLLSEPEIIALGNGDIACFPGCRPRGLRTVLIATPYLPFPLSHGGAVRIFNLMKQAAGAHDLILMAWCDELSTPPRELLELCCEVVLVRRHGSHYRRDTTRPDTVEEFDSLTFRACLKQTAQRWQPAAVQLEFTWMAQFAGAWPHAKNILVEHDITFHLQEQLLASSSDTGATRWELEQQTQKWRSFETKAWREVDCVVAVSPRDSSSIAGAKSVAMIPNGVDCDRFRPSAIPPQSRRLLFVGSFAHLPNLLALEFFLKEVWPALPAGFRLHVIAGSRPEYFLDFHRARVNIDLSRPGIELEGFVPDVRPAYERAELALATLTASAGTNIKVLEAMAMGRVVVGTPAGFHGLDVTPGEDVVMESTPERLADEIRALCDDPARREAIELRARRIALQYDWTAIGRLQTVLYDRE